MYILKSMLAQSHDSVPPAPAFMLTMAFKASASSPRRQLNSTFSRFFLMASASSARCPREEASSLSVIERSSLVSVNFAKSKRNGSIDRFKDLSSFKVAFAAFLSFQKSLPAMRLSSSLILLSFLSRSKIASQGAYPHLKVF